MKGFVNKGLIAMIVVGIAIIGLIVVNQGDNTNKDTAGRGLGQVIADIDPDKYEEVSYSEPGLINPDGSVHEIVIIEEGNGRIVNVKDEALNLSDSSSDDGLIIQKWLDEAKAGDELIFPEGIYNVYSTINVPSDVKLIGDTRTVFKFMETDGQHDSSFLMLKGVHNVLIKGIRFTSDFEGKLTTDHEENNPDAAGPKYVIHICDTDDKIPSYNVTVDQVLVEKYKVMGVRIESSHDVAVINSVFENATDLGGGGAGYGVSIQGEGHEINRLGYANDSRFNLVDHCQFIGPYLRHGVLLQYSSHNNLVSNNILTNTQLDAIDLHGEDEYLNEISGNSIRDIETGAGIGVGNSGASHDSSGPSNYIHDNDIENAREGIKVGLGSPDTLIENNRITGATVVKGMGIYLQNAPGTIIRDNQISNSEAINYWGIVINKDPGADGRGAGISSDVTIENNEFNAIPAGLKITAGDDIKASGNVYKDVEVSVLDTREYEYVTDLLPSQVLGLLNWKINLPIQNDKEIRQPLLKA